MSGLPPELTVRPEKDVSHRHHRPRLQELEIGDEAFDRAAWVQGPPGLMRAILDDDMRRDLRALFEGRLEGRRLTPYWAAGSVVDGVLSVFVPEARPANRGDLGQTLFTFAPADTTPEPYRIGGVDELPTVLALVLVLARRLERPPELARRLAENVTRDPEPRVRLACLRTLVRELSRDPATREALLAAREDTDADVRLHAGIALGSKGRDVLRSLALGGEARRTARRSRRCSRCDRISRSRP